MATRLGGCLAALALGASAGCGQADVYVAGYEAGADGVYVAKIWKNGEATALPDQGHGAKAYALALHGGHLHAAGIAGQGTVAVATAWRDGVAFPLSDGTQDAVAEAIAIGGDGVYVAGWDGPHAVVWKDGVERVLEDGDYGGAALALAVVGGDVYAAGYRWIGAEVEPGHWVGTQAATYWVNGTAHQLTGIDDVAVLTGIAVSDGQVVAVGSRGMPGVATLWRDGVAVALTDGLLDAFAWSVALDGAQPVVGGYEADGLAAVAKVWRGGVPTDLTFAGEGGAVRAVALLGGELYAAGVAGARAAYWKDGSRVNLTDGSFDAEARAIVVR